MISCAVASGGATSVSRTKQSLLGTMFQRARKLFNASQFATVSLQESFDSLQSFAVFPLGVAVSGGY
jgi:hypothetical protein